MNAANPIIYLKENIFSGQTHIPGSNFEIKRTEIL